MKRYNLFFKNSNEVVNTILSNTLEEAKSFFASQKQLKMEIFNQLFEVKIFK